MSINSGCGTCDGGQVYSFYKLERSDGVQRRHVVATLCRVCHPDSVDEVESMEGWTQISEDAHKELQDNLTYNDTDV